MADDASNKIRHNSPDPTKYHTNVPGMPPGTMIPRSGSAEDGRQLGADPNKPSRVLVDPGEEGGGFEVEMTDVAAAAKTNREAAKAAVVDPQTYLSRVVSNIGQKAAAVLNKEPSTAVMPPTHTLPEVQETPEINAMEPEAVEASREGQPLPLSESYAAEFRQMQRRMADMASQLRQSQAAPSQLLRGVENGQRARFDGDNSRLTSNQSPHTATLKAMAASTQLPFLFEPEPQQPSIQVLFDLPGVGAVAAYYHDVVVAEHCVVLAYDNRHRGGFQYIPAKLGDVCFPVSIPTKSKTSYTCSSLGLVFSLGCLDIVLLLRADEGEMEL